MREPERLRSRYRSVAGHVALLLQIAGGIVLTPLLLLLTRPEEAAYAPDFLLPGLGALVLGGGLRRALRPDPAHALTIAEGGIVFVLSWAVACLLGAVPLMTTIGLDFTQAVFESVSGWTTTGLSVVDVERAPAIVLLWRSTMQFFGGAGMAVALLAVGGGPLGQGFLLAEGRGDQLAPNVRQSARLVAVVYAGYAITGTVAYVVAGMTAFDAVNHSFAAISTGGFSTRTMNIGAWDSPAVEAVSIALMLVGSFNFQTVWFGLTRRWRPFLSNAEMRFTAIAVPIATLVVLLLLWGTVYPGFERSFRSAAFETVTALTTTGFSLTPYTAWPPAAIFVLIVLMTVGGHTGSTAGGLKQLRAWLFARTVVWEVSRLVRPRSAVGLRTYSQGPVPQEAGAATWADLAAIGTLYAVCLGAGTFVLLVHGHDLQASLFEMISSLSTVGITLGVTAPGAAKPVLWAETIGMFLGRLEFLVVVVAVRKFVEDLPTLLRRSPATTGANGANGANG